jgi:predicted nucleic acid-binding protein
LIVYFDTSALVPLLVEEPGSAVAARLWDEADRVATSRLAYPEARAALAQAHRMGRMGAAALRRAVTELDGLLDGVDIVEPVAPLVRRAGELAEAQALRAYDAVHLSAAESLNDPDLVLAAGDKHLLRAARDLHLAVADLTQR